MSLSGQKKELILNPFWQNHAVMYSVMHTNQTWSCVNMLDMLPIQTQILLRFCKGGAILDFLGYYWYAAIQVTEWRLICHSQI